MDPINDCKYYWQLMPADREKPDVFLLYNVYNEEVLFSPEELYDPKRRNVRTTQHGKSGGSSFEERFWRLNPQC